MKIYDLAFDTFAGPPALAALPACTAPPSAPSRLTAPVAGPVPRKRRVLCVVDDDYRFYCNVTINKRCVCRCLIDTGAQTTYLPLLVAQQAGVSLRLSPLTGRMGGGTFRMWSCHADLTFMGGITIDHVHMFAFEPGTGVPVIGMSVLEHFERIEFNGYSMALEARS